RPLTARFASLPALRNPPNLGTFDVMETTYPSRVSILISVSDAGKLWPDCPHHSTAFAVFGACGGRFSRMDQRCDPYNPSTLYSHTYSRQPAGAERRLKIVAADRAIQIEHFAGKIQSAHQFAFQ